MKNIEAIDLFCGIGGLTNGLKRAGIHVIAGLDNDPSCKYSYEKNNNSQFIEADISAYDFSALKDLYSPHSKRVLVGCAPCQPFSSHTFKQKNKSKDSRWNLIQYFIEAIEVVKPHVVSMENVRGFVKSPVFEEFKERLTQLDYSIDYKVVYCPDYGIPQNRSRLVFLASRLGTITIPEKTHSREEYITLEKTIKNLPTIQSGETCQADPIHKAKNLSKLNIQRIKNSTPGGTWHDWDSSLLPNCYKKASGKTYTAVYGRAQWNSVAPTITTQFYNYGSGRFGHPDQDRAFSIREGSLLQTFPSDYDFGKITALSTLGRQIGNAVPPKLAKNIGKAILEHLREYTNE